MAAEKKKAAKAPGKGMVKLRGRMPTKRSINLMVVDESKIKPLPAIGAILAILVLAAVFSKFLVIDRLNSINAAQAKITRLQSQLDKAMDALENIGDMDKTYAHYTLDGMTASAIEAASGVPVTVVCYTAEELMNAVLGVSMPLDRVEG